MGFGALWGRPLRSDVSKPVFRNGMGKKLANAAMLDFRFLSILSTLHSVHGRRKRGPSKGRVSWR